ncbi:MAG: DUF885 domain-containing protein [Verrucomicrobia bacterium]|nr:MAG: DUF885 domain-containing protein [Verrucomicrobiota bacterium]
MKNLFLLLLLLPVGCAPVRQSSSESPLNADAQFAKIAAEYISGYLAWRPQTGTALGLHEYDGKLTDYSQASIAAEFARLKSFDDQFSKLDSKALSPASSYDYRILHAAIKHEIFSFEQSRIYSENPMTYAGAIDINIYIKRDFAPLEQRVRSLTAILNQAPSLVAAARANLSESLPQPEIETAIDEANGAVDFLSKDLVAALKDVKDEKLMADFNSANNQAMTEMRNLAAWLKEQKLPKANQNYALGREKYRKLLEYGEMVTLSPEEILEIGTRELAKKQQVFAAAAKVIDPAKSPTEVFKEIQKDHPTEQSLIPDTAKDLEMIRQFVVSHNLVTIPSPVRAKVTETPQYLRATSFASMDTPGPFETKATEAYYYVTPPEPDWTPKQKEEWLTSFNYYTTDIVTVHEAYPGHYVQFLALNASPANRLEKMFSSYAFVEGWAHYTEQMMVDEGFGKTDHATRNTQQAAPSVSHDDQIRAAKYLLAQTDEALLRLCRLCVSIKMHCQGMTVVEATKFFQDNCYYEEKSAHQEAIRGSYDPEYLYYTLGKMEIFKLREDYRKQEGSKFSLQKFHDEFLRHGAPPIRLLREKMLKDPKEWGNVL